MDEPSAPPTNIPPLSGFFKDPLWFRCLVAPLLIVPGSVILYWCYVISRDGGIKYTLAVLLGVEPLGAYLVLAGVTLLAPRALQKWYIASQSRAWMLICVWVILIAITIIIVAVIAGTTHGF